MNKSDNLFGDKSFSDIVKLTPSKKSFQPRKIQVNTRRYRRGPPPGKWWWKNPQGKFVAAAGILIFDDEGIWVVVEKSRNGDGTFEYSDFGGKYDWNDGDIYATISREFREELYNTNEISYSTVKELSTTPSSKKKFIYRMNKGKYFCLIVHNSLVSDIELDNLKVQIKREEIIKSNEIHQHLYRTEKIKHLNFDELNKYTTKMSYRLSIILKYSPINQYIPHTLKIKY